VFMKSTATMIAASVGQVRWPGRYKMAGTRDPVLS
jgi:hypothetical protein